MIISMNTGAYEFIHREHDFRMRLQAYEQDRVLGMRLEHTNSLGMRLEHTVLERGYNK